MEENVAIDSTKQKQFMKSIKGIKKILKAKDKTKSTKDNVDNVQTGKIKKPARKKRGLVYLSHIPHGFYEHQMTEYFKQFGVVTNARVIRSKRTGMSKGHAFVEFRDPNVAQIVAETMNNYLMGKRLIKAAVVPPEKQRKFAKRKHWNAQNNPGNDFRMKMKKAHNSVKDEKEELHIARRLLSNLNKTKKRLRELDIDYDFFTPVDIPEPLLEQVEVKKEKDVETTEAIKKEDKLKSKIKKEEKIQNENKKKGKKVKDVKDKAQVLITNQADSSASKKSQKSKEIQQEDKKTNLIKATKDNKKIMQIKVDKDVVKETKDKKQDKKAELKSKVNETQKQKEKKLKEAGVKPPENFIQINKDDDESDSSMNFDSDEYDKIMEEGDSDVASDDESDVDLDEEVTSEEDESDENEPPPPKKVGKPTKKVQTPQNQPQGKKLNANKPLPQSMKIMPQKDAKPSKKPKFEKKDNKKTMNKVIKKKK